MKVAIIHDWLVSYRGGERVLESIGRLYPDAPIFTLFYDPKNLPANLRNKDIRYSKRLNRFRRIRKLLLPILPYFIENIALQEYDLVISTSSCVAKGIVPAPDARHICYIHSPMRYIWDQADQYLDDLRFIPGGRVFMRFISHRLRIWDAVSSSRVDRFIANSTFVASRVKRYYRRSAGVIHPPVCTDEFKRPGKHPAKDTYYLYAGAFVPYKRIDLAIEACKSLGRKLIVAGSGPLESSLRRIAGPETEFVIQPDSAAWVGLMQGTKALIFPMLEDFGIVAIEAMAAGKPVIAFDKGGAQDFVIPDQNGVFFSEQTAQSLADAIRTFEQKTFDAATIREFAERFTEVRFQDALQKEISDLMQGRT